MNANRKNKTIKNEYKTATFRSSFLELKNVGLLQCIIKMYCIETVRKYTKTSYNIFVLHFEGYKKTLV
jgi:hypothetical protein